MSRGQADSAIKLVNEGGTIVGRDEETDEEVSIRFSDVDPERVTDEIRQTADESAEDALDRATTGGRVVLRAGVHAAPIEITTAELTVVGAGRGTVLDGGAAPALTVSAGGVAIKELAVRSDAADAVAIGAVDDAKVAEVWVESAGGHAIRTDAGAAGCRVLDCYVDSESVDAVADVLLAGERSQADNVRGSVVTVGTSAVVGATP